ncbi:hypothetical protein [Sorangium sp. So ce1099]|uniref:hypothetical protein n=1 Tax=Sorangium sp. So ce1099 TaxID=3133331 RepID=UPI003F611D22
MGARWWNMRPASSGVSLGQVSWEPLPAVLGQPRHDGDLAQDFAGGAAFVLGEVWMTGSRGREHSRGPGTWRGRMWMGGVRGSGHCGGHPMRAMPRGQPVSTDRAGQAHTVVRFARVRAPT